MRGGDEVGKQRHTGYDELDWDLRADYDLNDDTVLTLAHQQVEQDDAWRTHSTIYGIDWEGLKAGDDQVRSYDQGRALTYLRLAAADRPGAISAYHLTLSRQAQEEDLYRVRADSRRDETGFDVTTWGASLALDSETRCRPLGVRRGLLPRRGGFLWPPLQGRRLVEQDGCPGAGGGRRHLRSAGRVRAGHDARWRAGPSS